MRILKEFLAIKRAISLNETFVLIVEITTGETRHIQQIYIDESSMQHCPRICIFKTGVSLMHVITLLLIE